MKNVYDILCPIAALAPQPSNPAGVRVLLPAHTPLYFCAARDA